MKRRFSLKCEVYLDNTPDKSTIVRKCDVLYFREVPMKVNRGVSRALIVGVWGGIL